MARPKRRNVPVAVGCAVLARGDGRSAANEVSPKDGGRLVDGSFGRGHGRMGHGMNMARWRSEEDILVGGLSSEILVEA